MGNCSYGHLFTCPTGGSSCTPPGNLEQNCESAGPETIRCKTRDVPEGYTLGRAQVCGLFRFCAILKLVIGIALLGVAGALYAKARHYAKASAATVTNAPNCTEDDITICDTSNSDTSNSRCTTTKAWDCTLDITYTTVDGKVLTKSSVDEHQSIKYAKGDPILVWYDTSNPAAVKLVNPMTAVYRLALIGGLVILFTCIVWVGCLEAFKTFSPECCKQRSGRLLIFELLSNNR